MSFDFKRIAAGAAAVVCAASMCGCAFDSGYVGTIDGKDIRNGVYLSYMRNAYSNAYTEIKDAKEELGDTSEVTDIFANNIGDKTANDWIKEETLTLLKRHIAIEKFCESRGISLSTEELNKIAASVNETWDSESIDYYGIGYMIPVSQIYGYNTMGEYYDSIGIGTESMKEVEQNRELENKLFMALYDTEGETPVSVEDYNAFLADNYAVLKYFEFPYKDKYGLNLKEDAEIQAVKDKAQNYADRINAGEDIFQIRYEYDLAKAQDEAAVEAEEAFEDMTAEAIDENEVNAAIEEAIAGAEVDRYENEADFETIIAKSYSSLSDDLTEYVWNAASDGKATVFETDTASYVVIRYDITQKEAWRTKYRETILRGVKNDEFNELLKAEGDSYVVEMNESLVNKKYSPNTYKDFVKDE
ncbi:MAG: hypothetical protein ACI4KA_09075 [Oscillospiraceae bacterium]